MHPGWIIPDWPAPAGVRAVMTTRAGGVSPAPYDSLNLGEHVGDISEHVRANRQRLHDQIGAIPVYLKQVHGTRIVELNSSLLGQVPEADAAVTREPGLACTIMVADCMPVLFSAPGGHGVGAAHAGWRGLSGGVLERTAHALCRLAACEVHQLVAWLGPCIGPTKFEVGPDVLTAFGIDPDDPGYPGRSDAQTPLRFRPHAPGKWLGDLPLLARDRLQAAGVTQISGGVWCTVTESSRFFSFRRDRVTGRMAACIWIES